MAKKVEHEAVDNGMTLDELSAFVADAYASGAKGGETVSAAVTFRARLRSVKVIVPVQPEDRSAPVQ